MARRHGSVADRSRKKRTPDSETRNDDPRDLPRIPEEWTREQFLRDLEKVTEPEQPKPEE